jgi:hypothetical protein
MSFTDWLQNHLLPCPFKYLTGIDCPGCGFQRSILELARGNLYKSFQLYPPAILLLIIFTLFMVNKFTKFGPNNTYFKRYLLIASAVIIMLNYGYKVWRLYNGYTASVVAVR